MFTGLIADVGTVDAIERTADGARLRIATSLSGEISSGDSVAVNGACLTAVSSAGGAFDADVMNQTLSVTSLGPLEQGDPVNLELPLRAQDRLGGHLVQGHVDATGRVASVSEDGFARRVAIELPPEIRRYVVEHGSIAVDGVSLTVSAVLAAGVEVSLIPETMGRTTLGEAAAGRVVNVEVDLLARYVERLMAGFNERNDQ